MLRRDFTKLLAASSATAALASIGARSVSAQSKQVWKATDVHALGYPTVEAVVRMGKKLETQTNGRYSVQMYPAMQLGGEKEMIEQTQVGAIQIARISIGPMGSIVDELNVFNMPFVFRDVAHAQKVVDSAIGQELLDKLSNAPASRLIGLCWMDSGARSFYNSKKPIRTLEDLKGLKIRMMGNPIFVDTANALGANGIAMGFDQLTAALQTGVVDGAENNPPSYETQKHYQFAKYYSISEHLIIPEILVFSKATWDKMSKDDQALLKKLSKEAQVECRTLWAEKEKASMAELQKAGIEVIKFSPEEKKKMQVAVKPVWDKYGSKYTQLVQRIQDVK
jgi:tripartite ATP-independent transporter DctP family solute receptor